MKTQGRVVRRTGATAWVRVCHGEFCGGCGHHSPSDTLADVEARDPVGVKVGQKVELTSDAGRMLQVMVLVFWVPLIAAALGAWGGSVAATALGLAPWVGATVCGLAGLVLAGGLVRKVDRSSAPGAGLTITRVVEAAACGSVRVTDKEDR